MKEQMIIAIIRWLMRTPIEGRESKAHYLTIQHLESLLVKKTQPSGSEEIKQECDQWSEREQAERSGEV
jgi:hypothetical protein